MFFGARAEKEKAIGLHYLSLRPLISTENKSSDRLDVKYGDASVKQPGLLSARLENIGNLPIESRDIDKPLSLTFSDAKILNVEITNKNPPDIDASKSHTQQVATISHKLLNPGDSISFDVLFDGKPEFPKTSIRVSGILKITEFFPTSRSPVIHTTLFATPRRLTFAMLTMISLVAVGATIFGLFIFGLTINEFFDDRKSPAFGSLRKMMDRSLTPQTFKLSENLGNPANTIIASLDEKPDLGWLEAVDRLDEKIRLRVPSKVLEAYELDPETAAQTLVRKIRSLLPTAVASHVCNHMPKEVVNETRELIYGIDFDRQNIEEIFSEVRHIVENALSRPEIVRTRMGVDGGAISMAIITTLLGLFGILVLGGTWRTLLGF